MADPVSLDKFKKLQRKRRAQGRTLCGRGLHKWVFDERKQFDVKQGKLVSVQRCLRCDAVRAHVR